MKKFCIKGASIVALVAAAPLVVTIAQAATKTANMGVSTTVSAVCSVSATDMAFGPYDPSAGNRDATSTVTATCTTGLSYGLALDQGTTLGGTLAARLMTDGTHTIGYNLYTTTGRTTIWGDGTLSTGTLAGIGNAAAQALTVYGRVPGSQYVPAGTYNDTVTVTITY